MLPFASTCGSTLKTESKYSTWGGRSAWFYAEYGLYLVFSFTLLCSAVDAESSSKKNRAKEAYCSATILGLARLVRKSRTKNKTGEQRSKGTCVQSGRQKYNEWKLIAAGSGSVKCDELKILFKQLLFMQNVWKRLKIILICSSQYR